MPSRATKARVLHDIRRRIDEYGWAVQAIGEQCSVPGCGGGRPGRQEADFGYTVGLSRFDGHPELIVTGVPQMRTVGPLNLMGERVRAGERLVGGGLVNGFFACGCSVVLIEVDPRQSARHLTYANLLYRNPGAPPIRALQIVWPDDGGSFPWEPAYSLPESAQPVLGPAPEGAW